MRFLDLLYADAELVNLLDWGIEGATTSGSPERHHPADGAEDGRVGYQPNHGWLFGNQFLSYIFLGDDPNSGSRWGNSTVRR
jgi:putative aldouronate transport system substrate-binding protein